MKTIGRIRYENRWCLVDIDPELCRYYRYLLFKEWSIKIQGPMLSHITVIAGKYEDVTSHENWGVFDGKQVEIEYYWPLFKGGSYYWLKANCSKLEELRLSYGLSKWPKFEFHITIGNTKNE